MKNILKNMPINIREKIISAEDLDAITEIRLRVGNNIYVYYGLNELCIPYVVQREELINILKNISSNSIYSVQQDINNGFVTLEGGHRIGVVGEVVLKDGVVSNVKNISSMNIRIAREYIGISDNLLNEILEDDKILNTIILSPPLCGKTTMLRDLVRNISNSRKNVCVVDERYEIAPMRMGKPILNIGERTDVISGVIKDLGMKIAVRSMAPDVVCTDEIGTKQDMEAIKYLARSGVNFICTMHGNSLKDIENSDVYTLLEKEYVKRVILLSRKKGIGTVEKVYKDFSSIIRP